jgi:serine/threonine-protein kinase
MLFELTTGKRLFKGASEFETLKLICERDYPYPSQVRRGYPPELEHVVMRGLAKDRGARYQTAREMQAQLEEFVRRERIPTSTIALSQFMQSLFEDKLASQKEQLLQGKQLADIIALQQGPDSSVEALDHTGSRSAPAASHTVSGVHDHPPRRSSAGIVAGILAATVVVAGAAVGGWYALKAKGAPVAAVASAAVPAPTQSAMPSRGAIAIVSEPAGATVWLNGEKVDDATPSTLTKLAIGTPYEIKLTKDGYADLTTTVTLTENEPSNALSLALKRGTMALDVSVRPMIPGVSIIVDGKGYSTLSVDSVSSGEQHKLIVGAPGYAPQSFTFSGNVGEKKHYDVMLMKVDPRAKDKGDAPSPAVAAGSGKIAIAAKGGWCNVTIDGAGRGPTPVAGVSLSAGSHSVTCTTDSGKSMSASVTVPADGVGRYMFTIPQ